MQAKTKENRGEDSMATMVKMESRSLDQMRDYMSLWSLRQVPTRVEVQLRRWGLFVSSGG